jgi:hypothetical protein
MNASNHRNEQAYFAKIFTPAAASELGRTSGARPLQRRYTNIYVWEDGHWFWLARHANVVVH